MFKRIFCLFFICLFLLSSDNAFSKESSISVHSSSSVNSAKKVMISYFRGAQLGDAVILQWTLNEEELPSDIVIERSTDGSTWAGLTTIKASGTHQAYTDANPPVAAAYRLRFTSEKGTVEYSPLVSFFHHPQDGQDAEKEKVVIK